MTLAAASSSLSLSGSISFADVGLALCLVAVAVQRAHQPGVQTLVQWLSVHQRAQMSDCLIGVAEVQSEVGAGTTIDRGSLRDTVIGEGTKIDNQVQIGHNVMIGRHCLLAAQIGLAGSLTIGDHVALGAKVGVNNHLRIGDGAQVTAMSAVKDDIPANGRWGGHFAKPTRQWFREIVAIERLVRDSTSDPKDEGRD